jgi:pimeloyl-ACP methyl ester carboxylesterase
MRPLEVISIVLIGISIYLLIFKKDEKNFLPILFFAILLTILQYYFEGFRWQLNFALFLLPFLYIQYRFSLYNFLFLKILTGVWFLTSLATPILIPVFSLPEPNGVYDIGTETFYWKDTTRLEWFTNNDSSDIRKLIVQVWYPGEKENYRIPEPYFDYINLRSKTMAEAGKIPSFFPTHLKYVKTNTYKNINVIKNDGKKLPVLIFSHGITGSRLLHQILFESLASRGYAVFALDHSYDSNVSIFPDSTFADYRSDLTGHIDSLELRKKQISTRTKDISFVIDKIEEIQENKVVSKLNKALNLNKISVGGHSYGGATAIYASSLDNRIIKCLVLDGWFSPLPDEVITSGVQIPLLCLGRPSWKDSDYPLNYDKLEALIDNSKSDKFNIFMKNTLHLDFTDIPIFSPLIRYVMDVGSNPSHVSINSVNDISFLFLERTMNSQLSENLEKYLNSRVFTQN